MLNTIWAVMILLAVAYGALFGDLGVVTNAALDGAAEAITLCLTMAGVVSLWMGLMEIAKEAGLVRKLTQGIAPFLRFMFPKIPPGHPAMEYIATNIVANVLGLGWACTPAGLKAMKELSDLEEERGFPVGRGVASSEMCTFLILNISSLQLIPVNMIAYRSQYGSAQPAAIVGPAIVATLFSTLVAVAYCKWKEGGKVR